jgi:hypothetical protein
VEVFDPASTRGSAPSLLFICPIDIPVPLFSTTFYMLKQMMMMMMNSVFNRTKNHGQKLLCPLERKPEKLILKLLYGCKPESRRCEGRLGEEEEEQQ